MKQDIILMGMPITIEIVDPSATQEIIAKIFSYLERIEEQFSVFKNNSEITLINKGLLKPKYYSPEMKTIFELAEKTKKETNGYFDIIANNGKYNPSGIVKGWAAYNASKTLLDLGFKNFYINAGGDIQVHGKNSEGGSWSVGIKDPFNLNKIVKVLYLKDQGIATSGTYIRGQHIYNPHRRNNFINDLVSFTVIGPNVYEADRFATAVFAMGRAGIKFVENLPGFEGYMVDINGIATMTSGFKNYSKQLCMV
jgi:thiamine biosynthesis lipoprotein